MAKIIASSSSASQPSGNDTSTKTLFIECTYTHLSDLNTGIQRVVRQLATQLPESAKSYGFTVQLVVLDNENFIPIATLNSVKNNLKKSKKQRMTRTLRQLYYTLRQGISVLLPHPKIKHFLLAHRNEFGLNFLLDQTIITVLRKAKMLVKSPRKALTGQQQRIQARPGDILLLLDSSWHMNIWRAVQQMQAQGVRPIAITYDLIPILHPQFLNDSLVNVFTNWFQQASQYCDGFIAISKTVQEEIEQQLAKNSGRNAAKKFTGHFILGADFLTTDLTTEPVRKKLQKIFTEQGTVTESNNTYLSVGTLEPRKNHAYLIDVFDRLWQQGYNINLCLVGRRGWQHHDILYRIKNHRLYNTRLFLWDDLNDEELAFCYQHSRALLFASHAEGFGLPIIEGLHFGLEVIASDIPVHREVGEEYIDYFNRNDPDDLVRKIAEREKQKKNPQKKSITSFHWANWEQSAHSLMREITKFSQAAILCKQTTRMPRVNDQPHKPPASHTP